MAVLSRTQEFHELVRASSAKTGIPDLSSKVDPALQVPSELNARSAKIGAHIHAASEKLQELRRLVKKKDIFEDRTALIDRLSHDAKRKVDALTCEMEVLVERTSSGWPNSSYQVHASNAVAILKGRVLEFSGDFKEAIEERMRAMEQQRARRSLYSAAQGPPASAFAPRPAQVPSGSEEDPEAGRLSATTLRLRTHSASRAQAVEGIRRSIGEVGQMVQKVAGMVTAQEEQVRRIEEDAEEALISLEAAQGALLDHLRALAADRGLLVKVFLILILFVIFFVVFLA